VSYWQLDESGTGTDASDSVGNNTLTNFNSIAFGTGKKNNAATLVAASQQYFRIGTTTWVNLDPTTSFSSSFWVKLASLPGSNEYSVILKSNGVTSDFRVMIGGGGIGNNELYVLWSDHGVNRDLHP
jgi:hypothetical protein